MYQTMKKKAYERLSVSPIQFETCHSILAGSVTLQNISVQDVKVEEFTEDPEFPSGGFDVGFD